MELEIKGNPGQGNRYEDTHIGHADNVSPNARTVIQNYITEDRNSKIRHSLVTDIINKLSDPSLVPEDHDIPDTRLYEIQPKIVFNSLSRWSDIIRDYALWSADVDKIYREFDMQGRSKSERVLNWLNRNYKELRDSYEGDILFDKLKERVYHIVNNDPQCSENIDMELLDENVCIVLVDAFMKCRIFEKPV